MQLETQHVLLAPRVIVCAQLHRFRSGSGFPAFSSTLDVAVATPNWLLLVIAAGRHAFFLKALGAHVQQQPAFYKVSGCIVPEVLLIYWVKLLCVADERE